MVTKIHISPSIGAFHVDISLNSWELPGGELSLSSRSLISEFFVDDKETLVLPKLREDKYIYNLPSGHRYRLSYQIYIEPGTHWILIEDDGNFLPLFGEDNPPLRQTEITLPQDLIALSNHDLEKMQQRRGLLRFFFQGHNSPIFSIAPYYGDRIFSGELYYLEKDTKAEFLNRYLTRAWEYMYKHYGQGKKEGLIRYIVLPQGQESFLVDRNIFFSWPEDSGLRAFEAIVSFYLAVAWRMEGDEALVEGLKKFLLWEIATDIYTEKELAELRQEDDTIIRRIEGKALKDLVARELSLAFWMFLEELRDYLGSEIFYPILRLILENSQSKPINLELLLESFSSLSWKAGTENFVRKRLGL